MSRRLSIAEAAVELGVSEKTVRRWIKQNKLPAVMEPGPYGEQYQIPEEAITTARAITDVVMVERPTDPRVLAMHVAQAVAAAIQEQRTALVQEIRQAVREEIEHETATLRQQVDELRTAGAERDRLLVEEMRDRMGSVDKPVEARTPLLDKLLRGLGLQRAHKPPAE